MSEVNKLYNVSKINTIGVESIQVCINKYLDNRLERSKETRKSFGTWINDFLYNTVGKNVNNVTWEDILTIDIYKVEDYKIYLKSKNNCGRTINAKMSGVRSLFKLGLKPYNNDVKLDALSAEREYVGDTDENSWGSLTEEQVKDLFKFCRVVKSNTKTGALELFFRTLYITGTRNGNLKKVKISDLKVREDKKTGNKIPTIRINEKNSHRTISIEWELYNKLIAMAEGEVVFPVSIATVRRVFDKFRKAYNITKDLKIVPHSIRKSAGDNVYKKSKGDLKKTSDFLGHKNINTTASIYIGRNNELEEQASYTMFNDIDKEYSISMLENYTKEELLEEIRESGADVIKKIVDNIERKKRNESDRS